MKLIFFLFTFMNSIFSYGINIGDEVEVTSAPVTAMACAMEALKTGKLEALSSACPYEEAVKGFVVFDVAEKQIYQLEQKNIFLFDLEKAFGGGSIDLRGLVTAVQNGIPRIEVKEYTIRARPKAGGFKGCL